MARRQNILQGKPTERRCHFQRLGCDCYRYLWQCQSCERTFCGLHQHDNDRGGNIECVFCEVERCGKPQKDDRHTRAYLQDVQPA